MSDEPSWEDIFKPQQGQGGQAAPVARPEVQRAPSAFSAPPPMTRREAREAEAHRGGGGGGRDGGGRGGWRP